MEHKEQVTVLQQLQSLLQLWQTNRSHCAHASFTSAVLTHDEQALDAPTGGTAWQRHGREWMSFIARQRKQLGAPGARRSAARPRTATGGSTSQDARAGKGTGSTAWNFLGSLSLLSSKRLRDFKAEHTRGSSEICQLKSNTSFK